MTEWAPRFTLLFLPISSALLVLSHAWQRKRYFCDHEIMGLHLQTLVHVLTTIPILLSAVLPGFAPAAVGVGLIAMPVHLIRMLRVSYGAGDIMFSFGAGLLPAAATVALSLLAAGPAVLSFFLA